MSHQLTFADSEFSTKRRQTRKEIFLSRMEQILPWQNMTAVIEPFYPKAGNGRRPYPLETFVNVDLEPADGVVDFGKINSRTIKNTSVSETFSVVMTKDPGAACTEQFNILGSFFTTDILSDYSHLDIGNGLLLKIFHNDGTATEFNRFSQFASFSSSSAPSVTAPFRAELSANPAETVVEGPFSKDVILKITYN